MAKKQIKLNEEQLRNFISYSVARLLKEGANQFNSWDEISPEEDDWNYGVLKGLGDKMVEKFRQNMQQKYPDDDWSNEGGLFMDEIADWAMRKFDLKNFPDKIGVAYNSNMTNHGRGDYDEPEYWSNDLGSGWEIKDSNFEKLPEIGKRIVEAAVEHFMDYHMEDFLARGMEDRDWGPDDDYEGPLDEINLPRFDDDENKDKDEYKGHKFHTPKAWEPKNPYRKKDGSFYTWDEYCELAKKDRERGEISEMIKESIGLDVEHGTGLDIGDAGDDSQEQSSYPTEASCGFVQQYGSRGVKCRLHARIDDGEVEITLFQHDPEAPAGYKWEPQESWWFSVEEYTNGEWLPYWETFAGDSSFKSFRRFWPRISKLLTKIVYIIDEDDEIPFR